MVILNITVAYKDTMFQHLIPDEPLHKRCELHDTVQIEGMLCIYQQNIQVKINRVGKNVNNDHDYVVLI